MDFTPLLSEVYGPEISALRRNAEGHWYSKVPVELNGVCMRAGACRTSVSVFSPSDSRAPVLTNANVYKVTNIIGK